jgi:ABC-2 type transport system permease protein
MSTWTVGVRRVVRGEWVKLWSVRSTCLILVVAVAFGIGVGLLDVATTVRHWSRLSGADRAAFDPVGDTFIGFQYAELAFGVLGVLVATNEYTTGSIRASLRAVPARRMLYAAKALVLGGVMLVVCQGSAFVTFVAGQQVLEQRGLQVTLGEPGVLRAVVGAGSYLTVVAMVGFGLGAVVRHTAGAVAGLFALVFLAWPVARAVESISYLPDRWLLVNAGDALATVHPATGPHANRVPTPGWAAVVVVTYLCVFLAAGAWRAGRDA